MAAPRNVRSTQEGGKQAGGAFTARSSPDRSDKEEGSRRHREPEPTAPQTDGVLQLAQPWLQRSCPKAGAQRPLLAISVQHACGRTKGTRVSKLMPGGAKVGLGGDGDGGVQRLPGPGNTTPACYRKHTLLSRLAGRQVP